jgi:hypothetical protein
MRIRSFLCVIMLALLLPLMAAEAGAQTNLVVNIPFDFTVCREQLPAGKYRVQPITSATGHVLLVKGEDNRSAEIVCTHAVQGAKRPDKGKLIFNRYGVQYFLSEMWFPGEITGNQLMKSEKEEALLKELPSRRKREKVTVTISEEKPH